ncbi:MAG: hypothetical protein OHK0050_24880 [Roseiflexaceae bacterium]
MSELSIPASTPAQPLSISLFSLLRQEFGDQLIPLRCTKATLVHLSHTLEDLVLTQKIPALLFTGFQESSHWREETERYRALAEIAQQVCIFAGGVLPPESMASELHITLHGDDPLRQEWFLALLCPQFAVLLCGQDRLIPSSEEALRQFDTLWSFEPYVLDRVLNLLEQVISSYRPDRLASLQEARQKYPLVAPDPALVTRFTSEMIRFEEELHRSLHTTSAALNEQLRWREDLTATLVHDMSAPLQGMISVLDILDRSDEFDRETIKEMLSIARRSATNLHEMTQLILDTNRLSAGQFNLTWEPLRPNTFLHESTQSLSQLLAENDQTLSLDVDQRVALIWADRALLMRIIQNLVSNASKFTPSGGIIAVGMAPSPKGDQIEIRVRDSGQGIAPSALPYIFDRYYQARPGERRGVGLGLYFCRLAIEAHHGQIRAASQIGQGTTITILLPNRPPNL